MITYTNVKYSDFFNFFNIHETKKHKIDADRIIIELKPGGFQEFIDIIFDINKDEFIRESLLYLDRTWVGDVESLNVFAKDIAKSYIRDMVHVESQEAVAPIVDIIFQIVGESDRVLTMSGEEPPRISDVQIPALRDLVRTYAGLAPSWSFESEDFTLRLENLEEKGRDWLRIQLEYHE